MSDCLSQVVLDDSIREEMRTKGLAWSQEFSWERTAKATVALYDNVIESWD